jgi:hypothetical protein
MHSDYVDDWDGLPPCLREALVPIIERLDSAADQLFDRRLNLSFEAAVKEIAIPGVVDLTEAIRMIAALLRDRITISDDTLLFDAASPVTAYDLPLYTPCLYLSQLAQHLVEQNARVWKPETLQELILCVAAMTRCVSPNMETARIVASALCDLLELDLENAVLLEREIQENGDRFPNERAIGEVALAMARRGRR